MHPTADTLLVKFLQRCGAAGDAGRYALALNVSQMNTSRVLIALVFLSLPLTVAGRNLERCNRFHSRYRNLESQAVTKVTASYPNERGVRAKGKVVVLIKVNRGGNVVYAHVICGHPLLASSSVAAAFCWKFSPRRVNRVGIITFDFAPNNSFPERSSTINVKRA
jgi:hypothetical protein